MRKPLQHERFSVFPYNITEKQQVHCQRSDSVNRIVLYVLRKQSRLTPAPRNATLNGNFLLAIHVIWRQFHIAFKEKKRQRKEEDAAKMNPLEGKTEHSAFPQLNWQSIVWKNSQWECREPTYSNRNYCRDNNNVEETNICSKKESPWYTLEGNLYALGTVCVENMTVYNKLWLSELMSKVTRLKEKAA